VPRPPQPPPSSTATPTAETASETSQAAVTFAVVVYLVGLVLCVVGNTSSGASTLVRTIKARVYAPVLVPAWLDLGFDYPLTYGLPEDADHQVEVAAYGGAGERLRLPAGLPGERGRRWRRLARAITETGGESERAARLAAGVAAASFRDFGPDVRVRVLRRVRPEPGAVDPARLEEAYAARVREVGGEIQLIRDEDAGAVAPVVDREVIDGFAPDGGAAVTPPVTLDGDRAGRRDPAEPSR
jgi:hypothetical protein